jgi:NDP-sugar pyrophosphorylase family protein
MKAMVLAAGLGTRLRPLTDTRPKALVEINGHTLLEMTLTRLCDFGIREVIVNVHHFADMVVEYLKENNNFGIRIDVSREDILLDTGGGLKKAAWFFLEDGSDEPFLLHNVDVISDIDFSRMLQTHDEAESLATLAVQQRDTSRYLLFDDHDQLRGRRIVSKESGKKDEIAPSVKDPVALAFSGIHIVSPRLLKMITEDGVFSIITTYLRLASQGERISAFRADDYSWRDLGRLEDLQKAERNLKPQ